MKKLILLAFLVMSIGHLFAELEVDIPFDMDIVGLSFTTPYTHETEWITITNTGADSLTYTFMYTYQNLPVNWYLSICDTANCFVSDWPAPIGIAAGASKQIHISVLVESTDTFTFDFTFNEGDLTDPLVYYFSFRTADYVVSADDGLAIYDKLSQNYPNPFNPSTTISYNLSSEEITNASISIYNPKGQLVKTFSELNESGNVVWNGKDNNGKSVNSGVYLYRLNNKEISQVRKMILIK